MAAVDSFTGATSGSIEDVLKVTYEPVVNKTYNAQAVLHDEIEVTSDGVTTAPNGGLHVHVAIELSEGTGAGSRDEYDDLPTPGRPEFEHATVGLKSLYAGSSITGQAIKRANTDKKAVVNILQRVVKSTMEKAIRMSNIQLWGSQSGAVATVASFTGTGPWVLTITEDEPFYRQVFKKGERFVFGSVSGLAGTAESGVVKATASDRAAKTVTVETVSGSPDPDNGDKLFFEGSVSNALSGIQDLVVNTSDAYQGLDPDDLGDDWKAVRKNASSAAATVDRVDEFLSEIQFVSGESPDLLLTTREIQRDLSNELGSKLRFNTPAGQQPGALGRGTYETVLPTGQRVKAAHEAKRGSIIAIDRDHLKLYEAGPWEYMTQGGDKFARYARKDAVNIDLYRYFELAATKRNGNGELYGLANDTNL